METLNALRIAKTPAAVVLMLAMVLNVSAQTRAGSIAGRIRAMDGVPAVAVRVAAIPAVEPGGAATLFGIALTDGDGRFRLEDLPAGRYYIVAGPLDLPVYYPGVRSRANAQIVNVKANETAKDFDFVLTEPAGVRVTGRIGRLPDPAPTDLFRVSLSPVGFGPNRVVTSVIGPDGIFEFSKVASGPYFVRLETNRDRQGTLWSTAAQTQIEAGDEDIAGLSLEAPLIIAGRVELEGGDPLPVFALSSGPVAQSLLRVRTSEASGGTRPFITISNRDSSFSVRADGRFVLFLDAGAYQFDVTTLPVGYSLQAISYGDVDLMQSLLKVSKDLSIPKSEIRVLLKDDRSNGAKVSGRVNGLPAGDQARWVTLQTATAAFTHPTAFVQQRIGQTLVLPDGTFQFRGVPWGTYTIAVRDGSPLEIRVTNSDIDVALSADHPGPDKPRPAIQGGPLPRDIPIRPPSVPAVPR